MSSPFDNRRRLLMEALKQASQTTPQAAVGRQNQTPGAVRSYDPVRAVQAKRAGAEKSSLPDWKQNFEKIKEAREASERDAKGPLASLGFLANPVEKGLEALSAIDMPRRLLISGLQEGIDAIGGGDASWDDFTAQAADESFGFGTVIGDLTGNKWLDRGLGFIGDVALDPLTYVTLGAGKFAGAAGRQAAVAKLAKAGVDEDALARIGRFGVNKATSKERELLGLGDSGLRFMGQRLPGTGGVADVTGSALAKTRAKIGDTAAGGAVRARIGADELADVRQTLHAGRGPGGMTVRDAADTIIGNTAERAGKTEKTLFGRKFAKTLKGKSATDRRAATAAFEAGGDVPEARIFGEVADWAEGHDLVVPRLDVDGNWVPHYQTPEAGTWFRDADGGEIFLTSLDEAGSLEKRLLTPGTTHTIGGKTFTITDGSIDGLNRTLTDTFPEAGITKWYEDDIGKLGEKYIDNITNAVSKRQGLLDIKAAGGGVAGRADVSVFKDDMPATWAAQGAVNSARKAEIAATKSSRALIESELAHTAAEAKRTGKLVVDNQVGRNEDLIERLDEQLPTLRGERDAATRERDSVAGKKARSDERIKARESELAELRRKKVKGIADKKAELQAEVDLNDLLLQQAEVTNAAVEATRQGVNDAVATQRAAKQANQRLESIRRNALSRKDHTTVSQIENQLAELETVVAQAAADVDLDPVADLLTVAGNQIADLDAADFKLESLRHMQANPEEFGRVATHMLKQGWSELGGNLVGEGEDLVIRDTLRRAMSHVETEISTGGFWKVFDAGTQFFKTYATLSPGFHVRNFVGATFMNYSDGVKSKRMLEAFNLFGQLRKADDPIKFLDELARTQPQKADAIRAMYGSGAGGSVSADELFGVAGEDFLGRFTNNTATRAGRKLGEWVEGPVRLAMALDSIAKGQDVSDAIARITRVHFDYSQLSNFDRYAKRLIPFWTFMSRNLPLQLSQIALKPKAYNQYSSFVRNASEDMGDDAPPLYWLEGGAFKLPDGFWGDDKYLMPDLQHTNLLEDLTKLDPTDPLRLLSEANPIVRAPAEVALDRQFFFDSPLSAFTGGSKQGNAQYVAESVVPTIGQLERILGIDIGGDRDERIADRATQSRFNYFGIPIKQLTEMQEQAELRRREFAQSSN